jgi:hypothetical protein
VIKIITTHVYPPIPDRRFDWSAVTEDYEPGQPIGWGTTEQEAVADLYDQIDARIVPCEACQAEGRTYQRVLVYERNAAPHEDDVDTGPCPYCEGTGGKIITVQEIEIEDLDAI